MIKLLKFDGHWLVTEVEEISGVELENKLQIENTTK